MSQQATPRVPWHTGPVSHTPVPFGQFIVKVHGRCNLACRYCYLYEGPDRSWRDRPSAAPPAVLEHTASRIGEHAAAHRLREVALVLHGGEPLLAGADLLAAFADRVRDLAPADCTVRVTVQTNATLLNDARIATLAHHRISVGISLDGGLPAHFPLVPGGPVTIRVIIVDDQA
ncbi:radical SAM protein, partial [Streptomyces sp. NPDC002346]